MDKQSYFLTELQIQRLDESTITDADEWQLTHPLHYHDAVHQLIVVPAGFRTDLASVPRAPVVYWLTGNTAHRAAVVHDFLCRVNYVQGLITWAEAAHVFRRAMRAENVPLWRSTMMFLAVRIFGEPSKDLDPWHE